ncbi:hypothetical protein GJ496_011545 [Pomphorhynchus laevis]|nr:hypothetical protein GJ496_011545 [Pomphorhynchus laevis]
MHRRDRKNQQHERRHEAYSFKRFSIGAAGTTTTEKTSKTAIPPGFCGKENVVIHSHDNDMFSYLACFLL